MISQLSRGTFHEESFTLKISPFQTALSNEKQFEPIKHSECEFEVHWNGIAQIYANDGERQIMCFKALEAASN